jgi:superfamily II DNA/RNA helicase
MSTLAFDPAQKHHTKAAVIGMKFGRCYYFSQILNQFKNEISVGGWNSDMDTQHRTSRLSGFRSNVMNVSSVLPHFR